MALRRALRWGFVSVAVMLFTGCAAPVEVWPPDWHAANPAAGAGPAPARISALDEPVDTPADHAHPEGGHHEHAGMHEHHAAPAGDVVYTCPMHPDVQSSSPGTCPTCGMALVRKEQGGGS